MMYRNQINSLSFIAALLVIFALSSCSSSRSYSYNGKKKRSSHVKRTKRSKDRIKEVEVHVNEDKRREKLAEFASKFMFVPYRYGGKDPSGFDCSGFTSFVFNNYGYGLKGSSRMQSKLGDRIPVNKAKVGDLMFFGSNNKVTHVGIVYEKEGNDIKIIHATSSKGVIITHYTDSEYWLDRFLFAKDYISGSDADFALR